MIIREWLGGANDLVEISIHEFIDKVDILEFSVRRGLQDVLNRDNLIVTKEVLRLQNRKKETAGKVPNSLTFSWSKCLRSLTSRKVLLQSVRWSNALVIFLIATFLFSTRFVAELPHKRYGDVRRGTDVQK